MCVEEQIQLFAKESGVSISYLKEGLSTYTGNWRVKTVLKALCVLAMEQGLTGKEAGELLGALSNGYNDSIALEALIKVIEMASNDFSLEDKLSEASPPPPKKRNVLYEINTVARKVK
ncbi:hypothetical protein P8825_14180 [Shouchella clausii]|uniref:hypothetical protein n=1 Tax=Shouchella clausii TaxID=79880 RepID=UPI002DB5C7FD|nr:hypothetical protein [Shouchella clausii]MEB5480711.1 hypothetical protein [Shouchella clausii]